MTEVALHAEDPNAVRAEPKPQDVDVSTFAPRTMEQLVRMAQFAARSKMFGDITPDQATVIMLHGYELGISPLQALREITVIKNRPVPSAALISGLICAWTGTEKWKVTEEDHAVTILAKRRDRDDPIEVRISIDDVPQHLKASARSGEPSNYVKFEADMLYAYAVRRVARRYFADILTGIVARDTNERTQEVVDVAAVERELDGEKWWPCPYPITDEEPCEKPAYLHANPNGGAYIECPDGHRGSPPQEVRDLIRGHKVADVVDEPYAVESAPEAPKVVDVVPESPAPATPPESAPAPHSVHAMRIMDIMKKLAGLQPPVRLALCTEINGGPIPSGIGMTSWVRSLDEARLVLLENYEPPIDQPTPSLEETAP